MTQMKNSKTPTDRQLWCRALRDIRARFEEEPDFRRVVANQQFRDFDLKLANGDEVCVETDEHGDPWAVCEDGNGDVKRRAV